MSRPFASAYLAGEAAARAFIPHDFRDADARRARTRAAAARAIDPGLLAVLRAQQARLPPSAARAANLETLAAGGAAVVITGQQVGLFLGPLYGFYKAASAVAMARALRAEAGVPCVPLFWLQTEDHDFAEIASATVADGAGAPQTLRLDDPPDARVSIAHRRLGPEVSALLERLDATLPPSPAAAETLALLRAHYVAGRPIAEAFAGVLAALFADEGLLVFDPREAAVSALAAPVFRRAIADAPAIESALMARAAQLEAAGFEQQIAPRPGCALLFFHRGGADGPRYRLQRGESGWTLSGAGDAVSDAALANALEGDPLRLSTSALLRPIVQDTLWPTAAYVGGPGELNYFAQLAPVYACFGVPPPLVIPRARFRCLEPRTRRLLDALGLTADDAGRPRDELHAQLAAQSAAASGDRQRIDPAALRARIASEIAPAVDALAGAVTAARPELQRAAERTRGTVARALDRLAGRYARALAERDGVTRDRLERLQAALAPGGVPQERAYAWPSLAGRIGPSAFTRAVMDHLRADPFAVATRDFEP